MANIQTSITRSPPPPHVEERTDPTKNMSASDSEAQHINSHSKSSTTRNYFTLDDIPPS